MKSATPKVLHPIGGRTLVGHAIAAARAAPARAPRGRRAPRARPGRRARRRGRPRRPSSPTRTRSRAPAAPSSAPSTPCPPTSTAPCSSRTATCRCSPARRSRAFVAAHAASGSAVTVLTADARRPVRLRPDPARRRRAASRRSSSRRTPRREQRAIREINSGIYAFDADVPARGAGRGRHRQRPGRVVPHRRRRASPAAAGLRGAARTSIDDVWQTEGVNDRVQLAAPRRASSTAASSSGWMRDGVTIIDPATTWIDADVELGRDVTILPGTQLLGATVVGDGRRRSARTRTLKDVEVGDGARSCAPHGELAVIGAGATVGPFSYLRPGTELGAGGKIGAFVETKNADDRRRRQGAAPVLRRRRRRSARAPTSAPARSSPTTTASPSTAPRSAGTLRRLRQHVRRAGRRSATAPTSAPASAVAATCRPARSPSPRGPQRNIDGWVARAPGRHQDRRGRRGGRAGGQRPRRAEHPTDSASDHRAEGRPRVTGIKQDHREEPHGLLRPGAPRARRRRSPTQLGTELVPTSRPTTSPTARSTSATRSRCAAATPS